MTSLKGSLYLSLIIRQIVFNIIYSEDNTILARENDNTTKYIKYCQWVNKLLCPLSLMADYKPLHNKH